MEEQSIINLSSYISKSYVSLKMISYSNERKNVSDSEVTFCLVWFGLVCLVLWHIKLCRLFNAKSIFM